MVPFLKMLSTQKNHEQLVGQYSSARFGIYVTDSSATDTEFKDSPRDFYSTFSSRTPIMCLCGFLCTTAILAATAISGLSKARSHI